MMIPACIDPTAIVSAGVTQTLSTYITPTPADPNVGVNISGGAEGAWCIFANSDGSVTMSTGERGVLLYPDDRPIGYASRVGLQRSSGVWGIVSPEVATVRITDAARPSGITAYLDAIQGGGRKLFFAPVSSSPVTITALDTSGKPLDRTSIQAAANDSSSTQSPAIAPPSSTQ
jgi:hypothetical protein